MHIPFTVEQFLDVFTIYNSAVWPMQIFLYIAAILVMVFAVRKFHWSDQIISAIISSLWLWMGIVYHFMYFITINRASFIFGILFIVQGLLFLYVGLVQHKLSFQFRPTIYSLVGAVFMLYALLIYPILGKALGHVYPAQPIFGVPCPTTIFTFGILLWTDKRVPKYILVIPFLWSIVGMSAAMKLGMGEDFGLLIAGILSACLIVLRDRQRL